MTIEKKSLISTLKTTKKANAVKEDILGAAAVSGGQKKLGQKRLGQKKLGQKKLGQKKLAIKISNQ
jgi:hypothetical protein